MSGKVNVLLDGDKLAFCKVIESLGYNHDLGAYAKIVQFEGREMLVKRRRGMKLWTPHTAKERAQPLIDHLLRDRSHG